MNNSDFDSLKPGDKVLLVSDPGKGYWGHCEVGREFTVHRKSTPFVFVEEIMDGLGAIDRDFLELKENRTFNKNFSRSDLKTGMRVQYRNGQMRVVVGEKLFDNEQTSCNSLTKYSKTLKCIYDGDNDIVKVWSSPWFISDLFNFEKKPFLIWELAEKTKEEIEYEAVMKNIEELQEKAKNLKESIDSKK